MLGNVTLFVVGNVSPFATPTMCGVFGFVLIVQAAAAVPTFLYNARPS